MELVMYFVYKWRPIAVYEQLKEVQTINHNYIYISLLQWTDVNIFINNDLNPDKHNTRTVYIHLFTFVQHVSVVPSYHREAENTSTECST